MFKHALNMLISTSIEWSVQIVYGLYIYYRIQPTTTTTTSSKTWFVNTDVRIVFLCVLYEIRIIQKHKYMYLKAQVLKVIIKDWGTIAQLEFV